MSDAQKELFVFVNNIELTVGRINYSGRGAKEISRFSYTDDWLEYEDSFPISPHLPLDGGEKFYSSTRDDNKSCFPLVVSDTCPDSWGRGLIQKRLKRSITEYEALTEVNDISRLGALRFKNSPEIKAEFLCSTYPEIPRIRTLGELTATIHKIEQNPDKAAEYNKEVFGSGLGGARPKSDIRGDDEDLFIAKYTSVNDTKAIEKAEAATLDVAARVGLDACQYLQAGERGKFPVTLVKRFDRDKVGGRKLYISAQTLLDNDTAINRYYTDIIEQMRIFSLDFEKDSFELYRRIAFTILISNNDDHLKNHGFLMADYDNHWRLAPMFDVNPQPERRAALETGIAEDYGNDASIASLVDCAPLLGVKQKDAIKAIKEMAEHTKAVWEPALEASGMTGAERRYYKAAIQHTEFDRALKL
jgi:serine/threonine-protein kinase HipA